ncbi:MAG: penicillin-binding protein 2 [Desulfobacterales bacterium]|nr:penicillin-binding protein 2 [Desulfobacterales bacterium]MCP4162382.1 penicillin-binding protein 2 [Deltaproteobacteria bacterium]
MKQYLDTPDNDWYKQRLGIFVVCITVLVLLLVFRLFYLQIYKGQEYRDRSENNRIHLQQIESTRGLIYDSQGVLLVENRPQYNISIIKRSAKPLKKTLKKLSNYTGIPVVELNKKVSKIKRSQSYKHFTLNKDIERDVLAKLEVRKFDLPGVFVNVKSHRNYLKSRRASHIIGYLSAISLKELKSKKYKWAKGGDSIGKFGVEKIYEKYLRGKSGERLVEVDVTGKVVRVLNTIKAKPGNNLFLTINHNVQKKAEELLIGKVGSIVAMDPSNGEIIAIASSPTFDQNDFIGGMSHSKWNKMISNKNRPMENKAVQGNYPPASIYKIVTAIAALEEGVVDEDTIVNCPGYHKYGNRVFRCWKPGGHGNVNIKDALKESCDVFFYQVGQKLGVDRIAWYSRACGFGERTGIDLDHESKGLIPTIIWKKKRAGKSWHGGDTLSVSIGQSYNLVTPVQAVGMISSIANGGIRYKPIIVKKIETASAKVVMENEKIILGKLPVTPKTMKIIRKGLWRVVNQRLGTAWIIRDKQVSISGKTGTAQVVGRKKMTPEEIKALPYRLKPHAWFVAYAPSRDPKIAVAVIVEHGEHGGSAAGPLARKLIREYLKIPDPPPPPPLIEEIVIKPEVKLEPEKPKVKIKANLQEEKKIESDSGLKDETEKKETSNSDSELIEQKKDSVEDEIKPEAFLEP